MVVPAELPGSLGNLIGHREDLRGLLVNEQVPVKVPSGPRFTSRTHPLEDALKTTWVYAIKIKTEVSGLASMLPE